MSRQTFSRATTCRYAIAMLAASMLVYGGKGFEGLRGSSADEEWSNLIDRCTVARNGDAAVAALLGRAEALHNEAAGLRREAAALVLRAKNAETTLSTLKAEAAARCTSTKTHDEASLSEHPWNMSLLNEGGGKATTTTMHWVTGGGLRSRVTPHHRFTSPDNSGGSSTPRPASQQNLPGSRSAATRYHHLQPQAEIKKSNQTKSHQLRDEGGYNVAVCNFTQLAKEIDSAPTNFTIKTIYIANDVNFANELNIAAGKKIRFFGGHASSLRVVDSKLVVLNGNNRTRLFNISAGASASFYFLHFQDSFVERDDGGAIYNNGDIEVIEGCDFTHNVVEAIHGGAYGGAAIYNNIGSITKIHDCFFNNNIAVGYYYGVFGGAAISNNLGTVTMISGCLFKNNLAYGNGYGAAIKNTGVVTEIIGCHFYNNLAGANNGYGGAIYNSGSMTVINNCRFYNNLAGFAFGYGYFYGGGNDIFHGGTNMVIQNCDFDDHTPEKVKLANVNTFLINNSKNLNVTSFRIKNSCSDTVGCPVGHYLDPNFDFTMLRNLPKDDIAVWQDFICAECPKDSYQAKLKEVAIGSIMNSCDPCPLGSSTKGETGQSQCTPCDAMYQWSPDCKTPTLGIFIGTLVAIILALITALGVYWRKFYKTKFTLERAETHGLRNVLEAVEDDNATLKCGWLIDEAHCTFDAVVAEGAFGVVYSGMWMGRPVALKEIKPRSPVASIDDDFKDAEIVAMLKLRHPRLCLFYGCGRRLENGRRFLVVEWMAGGSLFGRLHNAEGHPTTMNTPSPEWRLHCALDIAEGVDFIHRSGFVHRDLKSMNVLLDSDGRAKDFGGSRSTNNDHDVFEGGEGLCDRHDLSQTNDVLTVPLIESDLSSSSADLTMTAMSGTPRWCAPELFMQARTTYSTAQQADMYSFAMVLFELVTLRTPWEEHRSGTLAWRASAKGERPEVRPAEESAAPAELLSTMRSCWAVVPSVRPTSTEVVRRLRVAVGAASAIAQLHAPHD